MHIVSVVISARATIFRHHLKTAFLLIQSKAGFLREWTAEPGLQNGRNKKQKNRKTKGVIMNNQNGNGIKKALFDPEDAVILLLDHQAGLFQTVKDIGVLELRANTIALAKLA